MRAFFRELLPGDLTDSIWRKTSVDTEETKYDQNTVKQNHRRLSHECHMTMACPNRSTATVYHLEGDHLNMADSERTVTTSLEALSLSDQNHTHNVAACTCECHSSHREPNISCDCHVTHLDVYSSATPVSYSQHRTCREEAINVYNDITVGELAGYLDELLYLPRPMSDMAELMYT